MAHFGIDYAEILRAAGHRLTHQREIILHAVCAGAGHTTLKQTYARAAADDPTIDRSSVYRTLKLFVDLGIIVGGTRADGETIYEIASAQPHHHLSCVHCGGEQAIGDDAFAAVFAYLQQRHGFRVTTTHVVLHGVCAQCQRAVP